MDKKELESILNKTLLNKTSTKELKVYETALSEYLKTTQKPEEAVSIVIKGIRLDHGKGYFDYLKGLNDKEIRTAFRGIKKMPEIQKKENRDSFAFLCGLFFISFTDKSAIRSIRDEILSILIAWIDAGKISDRDMGTDLADYFICQLPKKFHYPDWKNITISAGDKKIFGNTLCGIMEKNTNLPENLALTHWLKVGIAGAEKELHEEELEAKIPAKKATVLQKLAAHYEQMEQDYREYVFTLDRRESEINSLKTQIADLTDQKTQLQNELQTANRKLDCAKQQVTAAQKEAQGRKEINDAFTALKKNDEEAILRDIAKALKAEYDDFIGSVSDEMDVELGEIYRDKLKSIFRILSKKGIRVN